MVETLCLTHLKTLVRRSMTCVAGSFCREWCWDVRTLLEQVQGSGLWGLAVQGLKMYCNKPQNPDPRTPPKKNLNLSFTLTVT